MISTLVGLGLLMAIPPPVAESQTGGPYSLAWNTLSSGVGASSTGAYQLRGSAGQPDAGKLTAGAYIVHGGFWTPHTQGAVGVENARDPIPRRFEAFAPTPNPFRIGTEIAFDLPAPRTVTVEVFGIDGRRVRLLLDAERSAGRHRVLWNGHDDRGHPTASGIYFARIKAGEFSAFHRIVRLD